MEESPPTLPTVQEQDAGKRKEVRQERQDNRNITKALAGEEHTFPWHGETRTVEIAPPCANKNDGGWYCLTHGEGFENQLQKDIHIHTGDHNLMWVCLEHGPEQP